MSSGSQINSDRYKNKKQICVIGGGAWGSTIARIIARNVLIMKKFHPIVKMYIHEEIVKDRQLCDIINEEHENVKYTPGYKFTKNLKVSSDLLQTAENADIIVFVVPRQFVEGACRALAGNIKQNAVGVSLTKGFEIKPGGTVWLISDIISKMLNIKCHVLMGANLWEEVAAEKIKCRSTLGCSHKMWGKWLKEIFETEHMKITVVEDEDTVETCGALKNIVAVGVGLVEGMKENDRYKEAVMRLGFMEMVKFVDQFHPGGKLSTFFESCGIEDLIVTSYGGRNSTCARELVRTGKSLKQLEEEMLKGQKLQGPDTAAQVNQILKIHRKVEQFSFFTVIHEICTGEKPPEALKEFIEKNMTKHTYIPENLIIQEYTANQK